MEDRRRFAYSSLYSAECHLTILGFWRNSSWSELDTSDFWSLISIKNHHSSVANILIWVRDHCENPLWSTARLKWENATSDLTVWKTSFTLTLPRSGVSFSGLGGIWAGLSHSFFFLMEEIGSMCSRPKISRLLATSLCDGMGLLFSTTTLMKRVHFGATYSFNTGPFTRKFMDFSTRHSSHMTKAQLKRRRVRVLDWSSCSPEVSPTENVGRILKRKVVQKPHCSQEKNGTK